MMLRDPRGGPSWSAVLTVALVSWLLLLILWTADAEGKDGWRSALASWYGPGLYGNPLGCGGRLYQGTEGVAHKSLPCGTRLQIRHAGRTVTARVIDRGPYVGPREFDLTAATRARLGFDGVGYISWREVRIVARARLLVDTRLELTATGGLLAPGAAR